MRSCVHEPRNAARGRGDRHRPELPDSPHAPLIIRADPTPELPAGAVLVRPDGYIGWAGDDTTGLTEALATWITNRTPTRRGA